MLITYFIKRTDLKISLCVNKAQISFFCSSMRFFCISFNDN